MHYLHKQFLDEHMPKFNPIIARGVAYHLMADPIPHMRALFQGAMKSYPPGFSYEGHAVCTPLEQYTFEIRTQEPLSGVRSPTSFNKRKDYELAQSDLFLVKWYLAYNGVMLKPIYLYVPFCSAGGLITVSSVVNVNSPVLADQVLSVSTSDIFFRVKKAKITITGLPGLVVMDGERMKSTNACADIYKKAAKSKVVKKSTTSKPLLLHYVLAKFGYVESFQRFFKYIPILSDDQGKFSFGDLSGFNIIESNFRSTTGTKLRFAIEKHHFTRELFEAVCSLIYILDIFPTMFTSHMITTGEDQYSWVITLGNVAKSSTHTFTKLYADTINHIQTLDSYIQPDTISSLARIGVHINCIYDLLALLVGNFNTWTGNASVGRDSSLKKQLSVVDETLFSINSAVITCGYDLCRLANKQPLLPELIERTLRSITPKKVYNSLKDTPSIEPVQFSGDNMVTKITTRVVPQVKNFKPRGGSKTVSNTATVFDPSHFHVHLAYRRAKANPGANSTLNPYCMLDENLTTMENPALKDIMPVVERDMLLSGKCLLETGDNEPDDQDLLNDED